MWEMSYNNCKGEYKQTMEKKCTKCDEEIKKRKTLIVKTSLGKIEIETEIHHFDKTFEECKEDCLEGWQIATYPILQELRNSKHCKELNLYYTWEFVQQPDIISKKSGYVAGFVAGSVRAYLDWDRGPGVRFSSLGVRYFRFINKVKETMANQQ